MNWHEQLWHCDPYPRHELHLVIGYTVEGHHYLKYQCAWCNFAPLIDADIWLGALPSVSSALPSEDSAA